MLKVGAIILSIGAGFQCVISMLSLLISIVGHAPILKMVFTDKEISALNEKVIATTKSLAILHNSGAVLGTLFFIIIIWTSLINGYRWAFWTLLFAGIWGHIFWFISDNSIGNETFIVNIVFAAVFIIGMILVGYGMFK